MPTISVSGSTISPSSSSLWLRRSVCPSAPVPCTWDVIDTTGRHLAVIALPEGLTQLAVRDDRVLTVRRDELGVEHLELYRLLP